MVARCFLALLALTAAAEDLSQVRTVYLLGMNNAMDQYLANRLTERGRFQVVTDPALADAVLTDRVGPALENRLKELYPPPSPAAEKVEKADEKSESEERLPEYKGDTAQRTSTFSRSKGNLFLIDRRNNRVLWSYYERPRSSSPDELDRVAESFAKRLGKAAGVK